MSLHSQGNGRSQPPHNTGNGEAATNLTGKAAEVASLRQRHLLPAAHILEESFRDGSLNSDVAARVLLAGFPEGEASKLKIGELTRNARTGVPGERPEVGEIARAVMRLSELNVIHQVECKKTGRHVLKEDTFQLRPDTSDTPDLVADMLERGSAFRSSVNAYHASRNRAQESRTKTDGSPQTVSAKEKPTTTVETQKQGPDYEQVSKLVAKIESTAKSLLANGPEIGAAITKIKEKETDYQNTTPLLEDIIARWQGDYSFYCPRRKVRVVGPQTASMHNPTTPMRRAIARGLKDKGKKNARIELKVKAQMRAVDRELGKEFRRGIKNELALLSDKTKQFRSLVKQINTFVKEAEELGLPDSPDLQELKRKIHGSFHDTDILTAEEKKSPIENMRATGVNAKSAVGILLTEIPGRVPKPPIFTSHLKKLDSEWRRLVAEHRGDPPPPTPESLCTSTLAGAGLGALEAPGDFTDIIRVSANSSPGNPLRKVDPIQIERRDTAG